MKDKSINDEPAILTTDSASIGCVFEHQLLIFFFILAFLKLEFFISLSTRLGLLTNLKLTN